MRVFKLFLSFVILVPSVIWAAVGKLTVVKGEVAILRGGKTTPAQSGSTVEEKDAIVSQAGGAAQLVLNDGTAVSVGSKTTFKIHEYLFEEGNPSKANAKFGAIQGAFKAVTGKIGKVAPNNFKLETKTATIGIRGTRFLGVIPEKGPETIACTKGEITVTPLPVPTVTTPVASASQGGGGSSGGSSGASGGGSGSSSSSSGGSAPASSGGGAAPAAAAAPAPAPTPEPVVVKAGEMTTVSVGAVEPPKPFTQAELKKLESAASAPAKEEKQEAKAETKSEKTAEKQEAKKEESKTEEKKESKQEPAAQKTETKAEVKTEKVETKEAAPTPAPAPKVEAAPVAPPPPTIATVTVPSSVTDSANAANLAAQQEANDKLAIEKAIDGKDFTVLIRYLSTAYASQARTGMISLVENGSTQGDFTVLLRALETAEPFIVSLAQSKVTDLIVGSKNYDVLSNALNSSNVYLQNLVKNEIAAWETAGDQNALSGAVTYGGALGTYAQSALDNLISSLQNVVTFSPTSRATLYPLSQTSMAFPTFEAVSHKPVASAFPLAGDVYRYFTLDSDRPSDYNPYELSAQAFLNTTNRTIMHIGFNAGSNGSYYFDNELEIGKITASGFTISGYQFSSGMNNGSLTLQENQVTGSGTVHNSGTTNDYAYLKITLPLPDLTTKSIVGLKDQAYTVKNEAPLVSDGTLSENAYTGSSYIVNGTWSGVAFSKGSFTSSGSVSNGMIMKPSTVLNTDFMVHIDKSTGDATMSFGSQYTAWNSSFSGSKVGGVDSAYISEDMWAIKNFTTSNYVTSNAYIYTLPDKVNSDGSLSFSDDYSSWGYGTTTIGGMTTWMGNFVAGSLTSSSVIESLQSQLKIYNYAGHALGQMLYGDSLEMINLDSSNKVALSVAFGAATPVSGNILFSTSGLASNTLEYKYWNLNLTQSSSTFSNEKFTSQLSGGYATTLENRENGSYTVETTGTLSGFYFGPNVNSVGGSFDVNGAGVSGTGVFKADKTATEGTWTLPASAVMTLSNDTGISSTDKLTNNGMITVITQSGTETWSYSVDGGNTWVDGTGNSFMLNNGHYDANAIQVRASGSYGSTTTTYDHELNIDTIQPSQPTLSLASSLTINNNKPSITGAAEAGSMVTIYNGSTIIGTAVANASGVYSFTPTESLSDGTYLLSVKATDSAGNISVASSSSTVSIDTVPPLPATMTLVDSSTMNVITNSGTTSWKYSIDGGTTWVNGTGSSFSLTSGTYNANNIIVREYDMAGNYADTWYSSAVTVASYATGFSVTPSMGGEGKYFVKNTNLYNGTNSVNRTTFVVSEPTTVTITTNVKSNYFDTVIYLLKDGATYIVGDDDGWIPAGSANNSIVNASLSPGTYTLAISRFSFPLTSAYVGGQNNLANEAPVTVYFSSTATIQMTDSSVYNFINTGTGTYALMQDATLSSNRVANSSSSDWLSGRDALSALIDTRPYASMPIASKGMFMSVSDIVNGGSYKENTFDESSWGYWTNSSYGYNGSSIQSTNSTWINGVMTPQSVISALDTTKTYRFVGHMLGSVNGNDLILLDNYNYADLSLAFGQANPLSGSFGFKTTYGTSWNGTFSNGNVSNSMFTADVSGTYNTMFAISGAINGVYFGSNRLKSIGGTFDFFAGGSEAYGVFKADNTELVPQYVSSDPALAAKVFVNTPGVYGNSEVYTSWLSTLPLSQISGYTYSQNVLNANSGYFVGSTIDLGYSVFGNISSMLFHEENSDVSQVFGGISGSSQSGTNLTSLNPYHSTSQSLVSTLSFSPYGALGANVTSYARYFSEDNKVIWGSANINGGSGSIMFASLPDLVNEYGVSRVDDYSSWGYWEAKRDDNQYYYSGYWVSGQPTSVSYIQQMIDNNIQATYSGHVVGDTLNGNIKDAILLNSVNQLNMTVNFGAANPVNITTLKFQTSQGWNYNNTSGFSGTSQIGANSADYTGSLTSQTNSSDLLSIQGKFYGPSANSTGGVVSGNLTGTDNVQRSLQGVYKARQ